MLNDRRARSYGRTVTVEPSPHADARPRARTANGERQVELATCAHFAARDRLTDGMLERMLVGVSKLSHDRGTAGATCTLARGSRPVRLAARDVSARGAS